MRHNPSFPNPPVCGTQNGRLVCHGVALDKLGINSFLSYADRIIRIDFFKKYTCLALMLFLAGEAFAQPGGKVLFRFAHTMQGEPLELQTKTYENAAGNRFVLEQFKYYLSNIKFRNTRSGAFYLEPESYHLVSVENGKHIYEIELKEVAPGSYNELEFAVGVDNAKNTSTDRVGALDPANQMAWNWHTGYKFISIIGKLLSEKEAAPEGLVIHVGFDENYRIVRKTLSQLKLPSLVVENGKTAVIEITVETERLFNQPNVIDLAQNPVIMAGEPAQKLADNYQEMFMIKGIQ